jgi:hypothetical protein
VVWCGVVWCGVVWCGVVWCGVVWCGVVWCVLWCGAWGCPRQGPADYGSPMMPKEHASLDDLRKRFSKAKTKCVAPTPLLSSVRWWSATTCRLLAVAHAAHVCSVSRC